MADQFRRRGLYLTFILIFIGNFVVNPQVAAKRPDNQSGPGKASAQGQLKKSQKNIAPSISGEPPTSVFENSLYNFVPSASDPNGDTLSFSIANRPAWANFNSSTGQLQGTPAAGDVATTSNIQINVSDGKDSRSLPTFSITVNSVPNQPPTISGTPARQVTDGTSYIFTPSASDPDGDAVRFDIQDRPSWASFNSNNGQLAGTPGQVDLGIYENILITVTDGEYSTQLPAFAIEVVGTASSGFTLTWDAPLTNSDGTPLTDLAGYRIYIGNEPGNYHEIIELNNLGVTIYVFDQLPPGIYFVAVTAVNQSGNESLPSEEKNTSI